MSSHLDDSAPTSPCTCDLCHAIDHARIILGGVATHRPTNSPVEHLATNFIIDSTRLLDAAKSALHQHHHHHQPPEFPPPTADEAPSWSATRAFRSPSSLTASDIPHAEAPTRPREWTDFFAWMRSISIGEGREAAQYAIRVRARAATVGISRDRVRDTGGVDAAALDATTTDGDGDDGAADTPMPTTRFLVCDHCRSHGIRCNEASVCRECVLREVPCTHRVCQVAPTSKEMCPREVCLYVHEDWMPDVYGQHNPCDPTWLVLGGRLKHHLSAGQLAKLPPKSDAEMFRCYQGVQERQRQAKEALTELAREGSMNWDTVNMACRCKQVEEEQRTRGAEEQLRQLTMLRHVEEDEG